MTEIKQYSGSRQPDKQGFGKAWKYDIPESSPAALEAWLVHRPDAHPLWSNYMVSIVTLADVPGMPPAKKRTRSCTHELQVLALDPEHEPDPDKSTGSKFLYPPNFVRQFEDFTDDLAKLVGERLVAGFVNGDVNPDTDHRTCQERYVDTLVEKARGLN
jgi:hypothetical protein